MCDLADADSVKNLIPRVVEKMGMLTALVNNASVFIEDSAKHPTHATPQMQVNHLAPLQLMEDFAAQVIPSPMKGEMITPSIINILDGGFGWSMGPAFHSYTQSRLALWREIPDLALKYAPLIRVNGIAPGHVLAGAQDKEKTAAKLCEATPLKRLSNPQQFCDAVMFLLNAPSVTGHVLELNGGLGLAGMEKASALWREEKKE